MSKEPLKLLPEEKHGRKSKKSLDLIERLQLHKLNSKEKLVRLKPELNWRLKERQEKKNSKDGDSKESKNFLKQDKNKKDSDKLLSRRLNKKDKLES